MLFEFEAAHRYYSRTSGGGSGSEGAIDKSLPGLNSVQNNEQNTGLSARQSDQLCRLQLALKQLIFGHS